MTAARPILLLLLMACGYAAAAQSAKGMAYRADSMTSIHHLQATILVDSSGDIADKAIIGGALDGKFVLPDPHKELDPAFNYWLRCRVTSTTGIKNWWLVLLSQDSGHSHSPLYYTHHSYVDVYQVNKAGSVHHARSGLFVPRSKREIKSLPAVSRVFFSIPAGDTQTVYIKIDNDLRESAFMPPLVELRNATIPLPTHEFTILLAIASGIMLILCILSLFFFFFVKDKAYLFFSGYLLFICTHYQALNPEIPLIEWFMPEHPRLIVPLWTVLTMGGFVFFFLFGRSFMALPALSPKTDKLLKWFIALWSTITVMDIVLTATTGDGIIDITFFPLFVMALAFIIRMAFFKTRLARIFVAGAVWLIVFSIMGELWNQGLITLPVNPWQTGQYGQLLIYCFGLAYKVRLSEQAKAEADRIKDLDEIKSRFFANISHEFRTPLTLIRGPLQQIEEQVGPNEKNREDATVSVGLRKIRTMRRHTDRLLELVNQLLDLSRLDSGKMRLQVVKGDVVQTLKALAASFESMAERKQIHYYMSFPEQSHIAFYDRDKLEKIVTNLLSNAFKYTPEKGRVSLIVETDEKRLRLSVEDSGRGIGRKELDKVFDRFYQAEGNEDKGTGIGLALVKELTDLYRGQISVSSDPGKGSRFRVSLPIDAGSFKQEELTYTNETAPAQVSITDSYEEIQSTGNDRSNTDRPLLLIVEDNADLRNLIHEVVRHEYQVIGATNGNEGCAMAIQEIPDLIISDVMMPLMDGFTLAEKLKKDERTSHIPIILLTAKASQSHKIEGLQTGADDYLTKPFDNKELLARVRNLINQRKLLRKKFAGEIILRPSEITVNSADENFLSRIMQAIETNMGEEDFGVEELAKEVAMSRSQLHRKLIALTGQTPSEVLRNTRLLRAKELLQKKAATPSEVAYRVGFSSHTYFSKCFKEEFGVTPSEMSSS